MDEPHLNWLEEQYFEARAANRKAKLAHGSVLIKLCNDYFDATNPDHKLKRFSNWTIIAPECDGVRRVVLTRGVSRESELVHLNLPIALFTMTSDQIKDYLVEWREHVKQVEGDRLKTRDLIELRRLKLLYELGVI